MAELVDLEKLTAAIEAFLRRLKKGPWSGRLFTSGAGLLLVLMSPLKDFFPRGVVVGGVDLALIVLALGVGLFFLEPEYDKTVKGKGVAPLGLRDGQLFSEIGRPYLIEGIDRICSWIVNRQVAVILIWGPAGAGKTSLVEAGVQVVLTSNKFEGMLKPDGLVWKYWPGTAGQDVERSLLSALGVSPVTASLSEYAKETQGTARVIVIDHLERLGRQSRDVIIESLKATAKQFGDHRQVWILIVGGEELGREVWSQLDPQSIPEERAKNFRVPLLSLSDAKLALAGLWGESRPVLEEDVVDDIFDKISRMDKISKERRVSPLAIGILVEAIKNAIHPDSDTVSMKDYQEVGGLEGLLATYLRSRIGDLPARIPHEKLLEALIALEDGAFRKVDTIGSAIQPVGEKDLALALSSLCATELRVLRSRMDEAGAQVYGLVEEWAVAVRGLRSPMDQKAIGAKILLNRRYTAYKSNKEDMRGRGMSGVYYLSRRQLVLVDTHIHKPDLSLGQREYIRLSRVHLRRRRVFQGLKLGLAALSVVTIRYVSVGHENKIKISAWGMPEDLYGRLGQFHDIGLPRRVQSLDWLPQGIKTLRLPNSWVKSLKGLPSGLESLDLSGSAIGNLRFAPNTLTHLAAADIAELRSLKWLNAPRLTSLDLKNTSFTDLASVPRSVKSLSVGFWGLESLEGLPPDLEILALTGSGVKSLARLPESIRDLTLQGNSLLVIDRLPGYIRRLSVDQAIPGNLEIPESLRILVLEGGNMKEIPGGIEDLRVNGRCYEGVWPRNIRRLWIRSDECRRYSEVSGLPRGLVSLGIEWKKGMDPSALPPGLESLDISFSPEPIDFKDLDCPLKEINISKTLTKSLREVPKSIENISFEFCSARSLSEFPPQLRRLDLAECHSLGLLERLPASLRELNVSGTAVKAIKSLGAPDNLESLDISGTAIKSLSGLPAKLQNLVLSEGQVISLKGLPSSVRKITFVDSRLSGTAPQESQ